MTALDPNPSERWAFVFPHPDDEIAVIGWIHRLHAHGVPVRCVWMHSTALRELESRAVFERLGLTDLTFGTAPDGDFVDHLPSIGTWLGDQLSAFAPTRIVTTAFEQGHLDHDSTNFLVNRLGIAAVLEMPLYHPYTRRLLAMNRFEGEGDVAELELSDEEWAFKMSLLSAYPSQRIGPLLRGFRTLCRLRGNSDPFRREWLRRQTWTDFAQPNLGLRFSEEIRNSDKWNRWISAIKDVD